MTGISLGAIGSDFTAVWRCLRSWKEREGDPPKFKSHQSLREWRQGCKKGLEERSSLESRQLQLPDGLAGREVGSGDAVLTGVQWSGRAEERGTLMGPETGKHQHGTWGIGDPGMRSRGCLR